MPDWKASETGKDIIRQAREAKGWRVDDDRPLKKASKVLEPGIDWDRQPEGVNAYGVSTTTWKRFLSANRPIRRETFKAYCKILHLHYTDILNCSANVQSPSYDWDSAPLESNFYGRVSELETLEQWLLCNQYRLILLYGLGGIGKTVLAAKLADRVKHHFKVLIWQWFSYTRPLNELLMDLLDRLSINSAVSDTETLILKLLEQLRRQRVLIVLDERHWDEGDRANDYPAGYRLYTSLLQRLIEHHCSCIILTTREKPADVTAVGDGMVKAFNLQKLDDDAGCQILEAKGLTFDQQTGRSLVRLYCGNPLALKLVASMICNDLFNGNVSAFLKQTVVVPDPIENSLKQQMQFLNYTEVAILRCLARIAEPLQPEELQQNLSSRISNSDFIKAMFALERRSLLEKVSEGDRVLYTLQPMVMKFVQQRLI